MATLMETHYVAFSMLWYADDPGSDRRTSVACDRLHGHAPRLSVAGTPGPGGAAQGPAQRSSVCLPRSPKRSCEGDLARWPGSMPVHQKTGERAFIWPSVAGDAVTISPAQMSYLLSGIDWRNPQETQRPTRVG